MPNIDKIDWGKNLRPSTVDIIKKLNTVIDTLNSTDVTELIEIKQDIQNLKQADAVMSEQISTLTTDYNNLEEKVESNETDLEKVKITLYTPLEQSETVDL